MKILCLLQNAWGDRELPMIFRPNLNNKSAKVMQSIVGNHSIYFCNTTPVTTKRARDRAPVDAAHMEKLFKRMREYDVILVCGKQAKIAFEPYMDYAMDVVFMPHPASRDFSKFAREAVSFQIRIVIERLGTSPKI